MSCSFPDPDEIGAGGYVTANVVLALGRLLGLLPCVALEVAHTLARVREVGAARVGGAVLLALAQRRGDALKVVAGKVAVFGPGDRAVVVVDPLRVDVALGDATGVDHARGRGELDTNGGQEAAGENQFGHVWRHT